MLWILPFAAGFLSLAGQSLLIRELLVVFQGNETTIGLILGAWLAGAAIGTAAAGRIKNLPRALTGCCAAFALWLPAALALGRALRVVLAAVPGAGLSLRAAGLGSLITALPAGLLAGAGFVIILRTIHKQDPHGAVGFVYLWESAGALLAGMAMSLAMTGMVSPGMLALWIGAGFAGLAGFAATAPTARRSMLILTAALAVAGLFSGNAFERLTVRIMHPGYELLETRTTRYGSLTIAERSGEAFFFVNGAPVLNLGAQDTLRTDEFLRFGLLYHPRPRNILIIGGSHRMIAAALDHGARRVICAEPDPLMADALARFWPASFDVRPGDPRVELSRSDPREICAHTPAGNLDAVIIALPYPATVSLNRYYTGEFFLAVKHALAPDGIVALSMPGSLVYMDAAMSELSMLMLRTLRAVFPNVTILPGDENLFVASPALLAAPVTLRERLAAQTIAPLALTGQTIAYRTDTQRRIWLRKEMAEVGNAGINTDMRPRGLRSGLIYWQSIFAPRAAAISRAAMDYWWVIAGIVFAGALITGGRARGMAGATGFAGMGLQMCALWILQALRGDVYRWIPLMSALFMAGSAAGARETSRAGLLSPADARGKIVKSGALFLVWTGAWAAWMLWNAPGWELVFVLAAGTGCLVGRLYPLLARARASESGRGMAYAGGQIYGFDLLGALIAAGVLGTIVMPAAGMPAAAAAAAAVQTATWARFTARKIY